MQLHKSEMEVKDLLKTDKSGRVSSAFGQMFILIWSASDFSLRTKFKTV